MINVQRLFEVIQRILGNENICGPNYPIAISHCLVLVVWEKCQIIHIIIIIIVTIY